MVESGSERWCDDMFVWAGSYLLLLKTVKKHKEREKKRKTEENRRAFFCVGFFVRMSAS